MLPKTENIKFLSWNNFLLNTTGVSNLDWKKNPLKNKPNHESVILEANGEDDFVVVKVNNEWVQISNEKGKTGWIKWRKGNKLLIDIFLLM